MLSNKGVWAGFWLLAAVVLGLAVASAYVAPPRNPSWLWGETWAVSSQQLFRVTPRSGVLLSDEELYLGTLQAVQSGRGFYQAQHAMFNENPGRWNTRSPLAYRQPLLTYLWLALNNGGLIAAAWAVLAIASMFVAFRMALLLVRPSAAFLAPGALALVYALMVKNPPRILYTEMWAAPLLVIAGALCGLVLAHATRSRAGSKTLWLLSALGALSALLALLVRELSLAPICFMAIALLLDGDSRRRRLWTPWAAATLMWAALYALHASQAIAVSRADPSAPEMPSYFHPGLAFLSACVRWVATAPTIVPIVVILCLTAAAGSFALSGIGIRTLVGGLTIGMLALLVLAGTPGVYPDGSYTGYWGYLFIPVIVAWAPTGLRHFAPFRTR